MVLGLGLAIKKSKSGDLLFLLSFEDIILRTHILLPPPLHFLQANWTATTLLDKYRLFFLHRREHYEWTTLYPRI